MNPSRYAEAAGAQANRHVPFDEMITVTRLPVPIEFRLPLEWSMAMPGEVGAPGAAFVALHPRPSNGMTSSITIGGRFRANDVSVSSIAEESATRLRQTFDHARVLMCSDETEKTPSTFTQTVAFTIGVGSETHDIMQCQVYLAMSDDTGRRAVIELMLTSAREQFAAVFGDFQGFVWGVRKAT
ncbi:MAG: hypothetical protein M3548_09580 [Actinomycetota bacterium]|nr:hypothetical protein [Actinomycetota bacterium]